jgi:dephospho-CoA kinase
MYVLQIVQSYAHSVSRSAQLLSQRTSRVLQRATQSSHAKSAHLKSQRKLSNLQEIAQQKLSNQQENVQLLSHSHALQSSLQIAQNVQSVLSVQSV